MNTKDSKISNILGGCMCGAVRYEVSGPLEFHFICQCRDCQQLSGSAYFPLINVARESIKIVGPNTRYEYTNEDGEGRLQVFCSNCGSNIHGGATEGDSYCLRASSLDDPSLFIPTKVSYNEESQHWDCMSQELLDKGNV